MFYALSIAVAILLFIVILPELREMLESKKDAVYDRGLADGLRRQTDVRVYEMGKGKENIDGRQIYVDTAQTLTVQVDDEQLPILHLYSSIIGSRPIIRVVYIPPQYRKEAKKIIANQQMDNNEQMFRLRFFEPNPTLEAND